MNFFLVGLIAVCQIAGICSYSLKMEYQENFNGSLNISYKGSERTIRSTERTRFMIGEDSVRMNEAQKRCEHSGGRLATLRTFEGVKKLKYDLENESNGHVFWIGGLYNEVEECSQQPFQDRCWFWDNPNDEQNVYNSSIIQFTEKAKSSRPLAKSAMVVLRKGWNLMLDYDVSSKIYTFICDLEPSIIPIQARIAETSTIATTTNRIPTHLSSTPTPTTEKPCKCNLCYC